MSDDILHFGANPNINNMYTRFMEEAQRVSEEVDAVQPLALEVTAVPPAPKARLYTVSRDASSPRLGNSFGGGQGSVNGKENDLSILPGQNYGGTFYSNRLRCSHEVILQAIGFHGPAAAEVAEYNVRIEIYTPNNSKQVLPIACPSHLVFKREWGAVTAKRGKIFHVELDPPMFIQSGKWYMIQFKLEGESTKRCLSTLTHVPVPVEDGKSYIDFSFNIGSMQMPELKFSCV